jgi:2-dehydropantoate 2-reductase
MTRAPIVTLAGNGELARLFEAAGAEVRDGGDEGTVLWEKAARLAPLAAATSLTQQPVGELRIDPDWRRRLQAAIAEACAVAAADGAELDPAEEWAIIEAMPPLLTSSTARDVAAGRASELDAITAAAVRAGRRVGVATPALDGLLAEAEDACRALSR